MTSADELAKKVIMSAYLYYVCGCSIWSDAEFDNACVKLSEDWDELSDVRKWELGEDPLDILSTACHVKMTMYTVASAGAWYREETGSLPEYWPSYNPKEFSEEFKRKWSTIMGG